MVMHVHEKIPISERFFRALRAFSFQNGAICPESDLQGFDLKNYD
jgi:hypothetical protein